MGKHAPRKFATSPPTPLTPLHGVLTPKNLFVVETTCLKHNLAYPDLDVWKLLYAYNEDAKHLADTSDQPWPLVFTNAGYTLVDVFASNKVPKP
jgi:hypothetical protein